MPDFQADTAQIEDAAGRLGGVASSLNGNYRGVDPGPFGFPQAQAAVGNFVAVWTAGGDCLAGGVTTLQNGLARSSQSYVAAEAANAAGMRSAR